MCEADTDPAMTAAGPATARGPGFFSVSLGSGRRRLEEITEREWKGSVRGEEEAAAVLRCLTVAEQKGPNLTKTTRDDHHVLEQQSTTLRLRMCKNS